MSIQPRKFQIKREDFTCFKCGFLVKGNGYTNHCPGCLWSRHVDINPGDREETCGGLMKPIAIEKDKVVQVCEKCKFKRRNKINNEDNTEVMMFLI